MQVGVQFEAMECLVTCGLGGVLPQPDGLGDRHHLAPPPTVGGVHLQTGIKGTKQLANWPCWPNKQTNKATNNQLNKAFNDGKQAYEKHTKAQLNQYNQVKLNLYETKLYIWNTNLNQTTNPSPNPN